MNIEQPIDSMTWGELRAFVALGAAMDDDLDVDLAYDEQCEPRALAIFGISARDLAVRDGS